PLRGDTQQSIDRTADKVSTAGPGRIDRSEEAGQDQPDTTARGCVNRGKGLGLRLPSTQEKILRPQSGRHIPIYSSGSVDADSLFPSCTIPVHDEFMRLSYVLADEQLGVG